MPNNEPLVPQSARTEIIKVSNTTAKTANPTNKLFTAGPNGSRIERIECCNAYQLSSLVSSQPASRVLRIYLYINNIYYLYKVLYVSTTVNNLLSIPSIFQIPGGLNIQAGVEVWVSLSVWTSQKDDTSVTIYAKDF